MDYKYNVAKKQTKKKKTGTVKVLLNCAQKEYFYFALQYEKLKISHV